MADPLSAEARDGVRVRGGGGASAVAGDGGVADEVADEVMDDVAVAAAAGGDGDGDGDEHGPQEKLSDADAFENVNLARAPAFAPVVARLEAALRAGWRSALPPSLT